MRERETEWVYKKMSCNFSFQRLKNQHWTFSSFCVKTHRPLEVPPLSPLRPLRHWKRRRTNQVSISTKESENSRIKIVLFLTTFTSTSFPLATTRWVRSTIVLFLHCPHPKQRTAVNKPQQHQEILKKILRTLRIKPMAAGREARVISTVLLSPHLTTCLLSLLLKSDISKLLLFMTEFEPLGMQILKASEPYDH